MHTRDGEDWIGYGSPKQITSWRDQTRKFQSPVFHFYVFKPQWFWTFAHVKFKALRLSQWQIKSEGYFSLGLSSQDWFHHTILTSRSPIKSTATNPSFNSKANLHRRPDTVQSDIPTSKQGHGWEFLNFNFLS